MVGLLCLGIILLSFIATKVLYFPLKTLLSPNTAVAKKRWIYIRTKIGTYVGIGLVVWAKTFYYVIPSGPRPWIVSGGIFALALFVMIKLRTSSRYSGQGFI